MTQEDLAYLIGKNQRQLSEYERGETQPGASTLKTLAVTLGVSADWLLELTDIEDRPLRGTGDLSAEELEMLKAYRDKDSLTRDRIREMILKIF